MSAAEAFVERLSKVLKTNSNRWQAVCPAHNDKSPSLSITEAQDGRVLIHCHAGCNPLNIVESVGLGLSDLFPPDSSIDVNIYNNPVIRNRQQQITADEWFVEIAEAELKKGNRLTSDERVRYLGIKNRMRRVA